MRRVKPRIIGSRALDQNATVLCENDIFENPLRLGYNQAMIIFVSGSLNSGKSSTARELKKLMKNTAIVEPDAIREFIADIPIDKAVPIVLATTVSVIRALSQNGLNIIVPYPLSEKNQGYLNGKLRGTKKYFFVLNPDINTIRKGRGMRKLTTREKQRIVHHYEIGIHNPKFGLKIDNTKITPKQAAKMIIQQIGREKTI